MNSVHPTPQADTVSHTLNLRLRTRAMADEMEKRTGLPVDIASVERAVIGVYRATGNRHEGTRTLWRIVDALEKQAESHDGGVPA